MEVLPAENYQLVRTPAGDTIKLINFDEFEPTDLFRIWYTCKHTEESLEGIAVEAVAHYAAAQLAQALSTYYGSDTDSTIMADAVQHQSKSGNWARLAKQLRERYYTLLNLTPNKARGHSANVNWQQWDSVGRDRITHPNRYR